MGIQLVAHSPLKRARQTSEGMLGCVTERPDITTEEDSSAKGMKADTVKRVVEMPFLSERTPLEVCLTEISEFNRIKFSSAILHFSLIFSLFSFEVATGQP